MYQTSELACTDRKGSMPKQRGATESEMPKLQKEAKVLKHPCSC